MNVPPAGTGSPAVGGQIVSALSVTAPSQSKSSHASSSHDTVSALLGELSSPAIQKLLQAVEERLFPAGSQHVESIQPTGRPTVGGLYAHPAPALAQSLDASAASLRDSAERSLMKAAHVVEMAGDHGPRSLDRPDPRVVLGLANQLIETGQVPNYLRAAELGNAVLSWYEGVSPRPPSLGTEPDAVPAKLRPGSPLTGALGRLWARAPLLALLLTWLLSGLIVGLPLRLLNASSDFATPVFSVWALGFPGLVVFQFVATIRGALRLKSDDSPGRRRR